jgi:hypothetical protein
MKSRLHRLFALAVIGTAAALLPACGAEPLPGTDLEKTEQANHAWGSYHWARTSNPFTLKLGDNVSSAWDAYLVEASNDWNQSAVLDTTIVPGTVNPSTCRPGNGRIEVCSKSYGNNGWLGIAQIWISGSHITKASTKVNDYYFALATYNKPEWRRLVMCQEIGHDFGLDHQDENKTNANLGSCMDYSNSPLGPPSNEHPNAHDFEQLEIIYAHVDATTTIAASPANASAADEPSSWGRLVKSTHGGKKQTFERDLGPNDKIITHVLWAE